MSHCAYPWQQMVIDLTGEVVPCCYWSGYGNTGKPLGNTNTSSLDEIWTGEEYTKLRERVASGNLDDHPCGNCLSYRQSGKFPSFTWPTGFTHENGFCFLGRIPDSFLKAIKGESEPVQLLEDGVPLAHPDALHDDIRVKGLGRFSLWKGSLYFSSSDNADPISTGRHYELVCGDNRASLARLVTDSASGQNLKTANREYEAGSSLVEAEPSMISLISTSDCNIDCPGCSQNVVRVTKVRHRPETVPAVLEKVPYLSEFIWHGGEPFLIKSFRDFIDSFDASENPNLSFGFTSNGTMITERAVAKLAKFPRINASVSIDSFNAESFARIRAGAQLERVWTNYKRLHEIQDAPNRIFSVGMIVCKSNMIELASNVSFAMENNVGLNLSPVVVYPVSEQLDIFSDFERETEGWSEAIEKALEVVADAKSQNLPVLQHVDPEGMILELSRLYDTARQLYSETQSIECDIVDPHSALKNMRRPAILAYIDYRPCAYALLHADESRVTLRLPRALFNSGKDLKISLVHDVMEPSGEVLFGHEAINLESNQALSIKLYLTKFDPVQRPKNIRWTEAVGEESDGLFVAEPEDIYQAYASTYAEEFRAFRVYSKIEFVSKIVEPKNIVRSTKILLKNIRKKCRSIA